MRAQWVLPTAPKKMGPIMILEPLLYRSEKATDTKQFVWVSRQPWSMRYELVKDEKEEVRSKDWDTALASFSREAR